jgi:hypothetical protein
MFFAIDILRVARADQILGPLAKRFPVCNNFAVHVTAVSMTPL